jgi:hypothetical protein
MISLHDSSSGSVFPSADGIFRRLSEAQVEQISVDVDIDVDNPKKIVCAVEAKASCESRTSGCATKRCQVTD